MEGRDYVTPDDVKRFAQAALAHRLALDSSLWDIRGSGDAIIGEILKAMPVPVVEDENEL